MVKRRAVGVTLFHFLLGEKIWSYGIVRLVEYTASETERRFLLIVLRGRLKLQGQLEQSVIVVRCFKQCSHVNVLVE